MKKTRYERQKEVRRRKAAGLVAVTVKGVSYDLPETRVDDLIKWLKEQSAD